MLTHHPALHSVSSAVDSSSLSVNNFELANEEPAPPASRVNNWGYFNRVLPTPVHVDNFYHRLLHACHQDTFQQTSVHESFLHPTLCKEWVQDYKMSLNTRPPRVSLPLAATLELSLAAWLKTALLKSGSLDRNLDPCKSYACLLLHSIWSPAQLLFVKAQATPPHAPRLWTIVENAPHTGLTAGSVIQQRIEVHGLDAGGEKQLLLTCEGCHVATGPPYSTMTANNVTHRNYEFPLSGDKTPSPPEIDTDAYHLPEPSALFLQVRVAFLTAHQSISSSSCEQIVMAGDKTSPSLAVERLQYGPTFLSYSPSSSSLPSLVQSIGTLGHAEFTLLSGPLSLQKLSAMQDQYLVPPPVLEMMLHQVLNAYVSSSRTASDPVLLMLPRAVAIEGMYVQYQVLSKLFAAGNTCSVMIATTSSKNIHEYTPAESDSDGDDEDAKDQIDKENMRQTKLLNLDCSLLSAEGDVIVHAFNVLYHYLVEETAASGSAPPDDVQALGFLKVKHDRNHSNRQRSRKRKKQQRKGQGNVESSPAQLSAVQIFAQIRVTAELFVDGDLSDEAVLTDCGLDSLASAEFIGKLSSMFHLSLPPTLVLHYKTIGEIQVYVTDLLLASKQKIETVENPPSVLTASVGILADHYNHRGEKSLEATSDTQLEVGVESIYVHLEEESHHHKDTAENNCEAVEQTEDQEQEPEPEHQYAEREEERIESGIRSRVGSSEHCNGNTVQGNPWFSVFYASGSGEPRYRMVLCTGQAQGTAPWCAFAEVLNSAGIDVYVVRIPGQFERGEEPPYEGTFVDICTEVCNGLAALGCLDDESSEPLTLAEEAEGGAGSWKLKNPAIPLALLGFSLGTCFTVGIAQCLQCSRGVQVAQVVSIGGLTHQKMKSLKSQSVPYTPPLLIETLVTFFGRAPDALHQFLASADEDAITTIMRYFDEGFRFAREWMKDMDVKLTLAQHVLRVNFMWVVGSRDISCPVRDLGWQQFVDERNQFEILIYPGDHFFQVESPEADRAVATDVARAMLRKLETYSWGDASQPE